MNNERVDQLDETAFGELVQRYRPELQAHCYRMLGSFHESEDLVQETFLRAWHKRHSYQGRAPFRAWLYRIATNACLDTLDRRQHTPFQRDANPPANPDAALLPAVAIPWLQPYPDHLLDTIADDDTEPDAALVAKETIELAFLTAIQYLPPRQRAVLILRDVLGWSAKQTATLLDSSVASVNSALQRARPTLRKYLPRRRLDWTPTTQPTQDEQAVLRRYMTALEQSDDHAVATLLRADARCSQEPGAGGHPGPDPIWYEGRDTIINAWSPAFHGPHAVRFRVLPTRANRQPAAATYAQWPGAADYQAFGLTVLHILDGTVTELTVFTPELYPAFGLPQTR